ncbi:MAG: putative holin-like toxin [Oscillospiraceae bacterium]|nr:putative holin-like toxin [Oscillospiraceae bacterium]
MTTYEVLSLVLAFGMLVIALLQARK